MENIAHCPDCKRKLIAEELATHMCPDVTPMEMEIKGRPLLLLMKDKTLMLAETTDGKTLAITFNQVISQNAQAI